MTFYYSMTNPYPQILNLAGTGLNDGDVYIGVAGQDPITNPKQLYWDADATIPAAQPLQVTGGYIYRSGTPAAPYLTGPYSIKVLDKNGALVYYQANVLDEVLNFISELQTTAGPGLIPASHAVSYIPGTLGARFKKDIYVTDAPFNAKGDGATPDQAAVQAAVDFAEGLGIPAQIVFPKGEYLFTNPVLISANDISLVGCGKIHSVSSEFTTTYLIPGFSSSTAAAFVFWNGNPLNVASLATSANDGDLQNNIEVTGLTIYDDYNHGSGLDVLSAALVLAGINGLNIHGCKFSGFSGEIIKGAVKNYNVSGNQVRDSSNQFISWFDCNGTISGNNLYEVGAFYEGPGLNVTATGNVGQYIGSPTGVTATKYIANVGYGGVLMETRCAFADNVFTNVNITGGYLFSDVSPAVSNQMISISLTNNIVIGNYKDFGPIYFATPASDIGHVLIEGNTLMDEVGNTDNYAALIVLGNQLASTVFPNFVVRNNNLTVRSTGKARSVIECVNNPNGRIRGNTIKKPNALRAGVVGYALGDGAIWISSTAAASAFGLPLVDLGHDNTVNGVLVGDPCDRVTALATGNVLDTQGRTFIPMDNPGALAVDEVYATIGETITVSPLAGTVTFNATANFQTSTGVAEPVTAGQLYQFKVYTFQAGTTQKVKCKALGAPVTI